MRLRTEQLKQTNDWRSREAASSPPWLPRELRLYVVKSTVWQAFLWSLSVWAVKASKRQDFELVRENGGKRDRCEALACGWTWISEICAFALRCGWWRWRQLCWKDVKKDKWAGGFELNRWEDTESPDFSTACGHNNRQNDFNLPRNGGEARRLVASHGHEWRRPVATSGDRNSLQNFCKASI